MELEKPPLFHHDVTASNVPCTDMVICFKISRMLVISYVLFLGKTRVSVLRARKKERKKHRVKESVSVIQKHYGNMKPLVSVAFPQRG